MDYELLDSGQRLLYEVITSGPGPQGKLPLSDDLLCIQPSGHAFGMSQDVGMGLLLSTPPKLLNSDGTPKVAAPLAEAWCVVFRRQKMTAERQNPCGRQTANKQ